MINEILAALVGILIAVLIKRKDIAEILRLHREIERLDREINENLGVKPLPA